MNLKPNEIRVALADDQPLVAEGLGYVLERCGFTLVGISHSGKGAIDLVRRLEPHILVLDLMMPDMDGFAVAEALREEQSQVSIIVLTASNKPQDAARAMKYGISGYLVKDTDSDRLCDLLMMVALEGRGVERDLVESVFAWKESKQSKDESGLIEPLTEHQKRVLGLISLGQTNSEIASVLSISENTVKTHVRHIYQKLNVTDRANAVIWAFQNGLVPVVRTGPE